VKNKTLKVAESTMAATEMVERDVEKKTWGPFEGVTASIIGHERATASIYPHESRTSLP